MKSNFSDYLSEQEMKRIAEESFREHCDSFFSSQSGNVDNIERMISNIGHDVAESIVERHMGEDMGKLISDKAASVISGLSEFTVFRKADAWGRNDSKGWEYLQESMQENRHLIDERVRELFKSAPQREILDFVEEAASEIIEERLFGTKEKQS